MHFLQIAAVLMAAATSVQALPNTCRPEGCRPLYCEISIHRGVKDPFGGPLDPKTRESVFAGTIKQQATDAIKRIQARVAVIYPGITNTFTSAPPQQVVQEIFKIDRLMKPDETHVNYWARVTISVWSAGWQFPMRGDSVDQVDLPGVDDVLKAYLRRCRGPNRDSSFLKRIYPGRTSRRTALYTLLSPRS